ncbi:MAG: hypothetical protein ACFB03_13610 [Paracoccaceae bacterium]
MHLHTAGFDKFISDVWRIFGVPIISVSVLSVIFVGPLSKLFAELLESDALSASNVGKVWSLYQSTVESFGNPHAETLVQIFSNVSIAVLFALGVMVFVMDQSIRMIGRAPRYLSQEFIDLSGKVLLNRIRLTLPEKRYEFDTNEESVFNDIIQAKYESDAAKNNPIFYEVMKSLDDQMDFSLVLLDYCISFFIISVIVLIYGAFSANLGEIMPSICASTFLVLGFFAVKRYRRLQVESSAHAVLATCARRC